MQVRIPQSGLRVNQFWALIGQSNFGAAHIPAHFDEETLIAQINDRAKNLRIVAPISKLLACGDIGVGAMAEVDAVVAAVESMLTPK